MPVLLTRLLLAKPLPPPLLLPPLLLLLIMGLLLLSMKKNCRPALPSAMEDTGAARPCEHGMQLVTSALSAGHKARGQAHMKQHASCRPGMSRQVGRRVTVVKAWAGAPIRRCGPPRPQPAPPTAS